MFLNMNTLFQIIQIPTVAQSTGNFINICKTLIDRNQMRKCWEQSGDNCLQNDEIVPGVQKNITIQSLPKHMQLPVSRFFGCSVTNEVLFVKSVTVNCVNYKIDDCFFLDVLDNDVPVFFIISNILSFDGVWGLVGNLAICTEFVSHFHAYAVIKDADCLVLRPGTELCYDALDKWICIQFMSRLWSSS